MSEDPWKDLEPPSSAATITARRIDATLRWDFFWAKGVDGRCMLVLGHGVDAAAEGRIPKLHGIEIFDSEAQPKSRRMLAFRLLAPEHKDLFYRLCSDIVETASRVETEDHAVEVALVRTWRWHHLLRGGADGRLSLEQQKGLIGELTVLRDVLLPYLSQKDAVTAWHGPLGAPKDFIIGRICIEAKARRGATKPYVSISTPEQLDDAALDALFLHVVDLDQVPPASGHGFSLTEVARAIRERLALGQPAAADLYESLLLAAGFSWHDDYSDTHWLQGDSRLFAVRGEFPRIVCAGVPTGVIQLKYAISLVECLEYETDMTAVTEAIRREHDGV